ncbi:MAG: electron transfer flavoprotein subunit alpha [Dehalococcoidia bacterium]|nr:electron transfer flavoprotein subunit alpha [Dehalococcoidia bacterium]
MEGQKKIKKPLGVARLLVNKCISCGARCQAVCPKHCIEMNDEDQPIIDISRCTGCRKCLKACPSEAIEIYFTPEQQKILDEIARQGHTVEHEPDKVVDRAEGHEDYRGVWVFVEQVDGEPAAVAWELLGVGAALAKQLHVDLCAVIVGDKVELICSEAIAYGANKIYIIDDPVFRYYRTEPYVKALTYLVRKYKPEIMLIGATGVGRDLAGAVATELKTGLTADCTGLAVDSDRRLLMQTRPAFGGNIMATIVTESSWPQMSTVRPHTMHMHPKNPSNKGQIIHEKLELNEDDICTKIVEIIERKQSGEVDVAGADFIISGGRGMQSSQNFSILQELADELGGVVACSRSAVDAGWMPQERQVGQTGKTVRPKIYIACGISGAIQHLVGMQNSDIIVAINRDKHAPIFEVAHYGLVGDLFKIVPAITKQIKALRASGKKNK